MFQQLPEPPRDRNKQPNGLRSSLAFLFRLVDEIPEPSVRIVEVVQFWTLRFVDDIRPQQPGLVVRSRREPILRPKPEYIVRQENSLPECRRGYVSQPRPLAAIQHLPIDQPPELLERDGLALKILVGAGLPHHVHIPARRILWSLWHQTGLGQPPQKFHDRVERLAAGSRGITLVLRPQVPCVVPENILFLGDLLEERSFAPLLQPRLKPHDSLNIRPDRLQLVLQQFLRLQIGSV